MLFSSLLFICIFLVVVIAVNYLFNLIPFKDENKRMFAKNIWLLIASLIFYAWGGIYYLLIMVSSICINYFGGILIGKKIKEEKYKKLSFVLVIILNLSILFFFKYFNMLVVCIESIIELKNGFASSWNSLISMEGTGVLELKKIVLPIGISFFTFQAMSYVIDVYTKKANVQDSIIDFALYVSLFPQLIAGPIVKYSDIEYQLHHRKESLDEAMYGIKRFIYGLAKKVLIANTVALVADNIWALETEKLGAPLAWLGVICYTLQIYYDFSGYSDMAIGLGHLFGFSFKENFNYPYTSNSIQEFWRRWHISLSSWFKEYVYIPLGGNRKGNVRTYINVFLVFLLTGIWHGANFTFILWGVYFAFFQIIERLFLGKLLEKNKLKFFNWLYMILVVMIGWVLFRSDNIFQAIEYLKQMFSFKASSTYSLISYLSMSSIIMIAVGVLLSGHIQKPFAKKIDFIRNKNWFIIIDYIYQIALLIICIASLVSGTYNPFIYFQF